MKTRLKKLRSMLTPAVDSGPISSIFREAGERVRIQWKLPKHLVTYEKRAPSKLGPFGGGWDWKVGAHGADGEVILFFKTFSIRVSKR